MVFIVIILQGPGAEKPVAAPPAASQPTE